jgi:hypothetical protein
LNCIRGPVDPDPVPRRPKMNKKLISCFKELVVLPRELESSPGSFKSINGSLRWNILQF